MNTYNQFMEVMLQAPDQYLITLENYRKTGILINRLAYFKYLCNLEKPDPSLENKEVDRGI